MIKIDPSQFILIVGCGVPGKAAIELLVAKGYKNIGVLDSNIQFVESWQKQNLPDINLRLHPNIESIDVSYSYAVLSPGISTEHPIYNWIEQHSLPWLSEVDLAFSLSPGNSIVITGTNGKSTVTQLIGDCFLGQSENIEVGGNIGTAVCLLAKNSIHSKKRPLWILELSSYQLETSRKPQAQIAVFTSFSSDHLERHKSLKNYFCAKWQIINRLSTGGSVILPDYIFKKADEWNLLSRKDITYCILKTSMENSYGEIVNKLNLKSKLFLLNQKNKNLIHAETDQYYDLSSRFCEFDHNLFNTSLTLISCLEYFEKRFDFASFMNSVNLFKSLPYRFELLLDSKYIKIINDSKSTNLESLTTALDSCMKPIILLAGGVSKGDEFTILNRYKDKIHHAICFGKHGKDIYKDIDNIRSKSCFLSLREAIRDIFKYIQKNTHYTILFSPGCASFDEFKNFEERGLFFNQEISKEKEFINWKKEAKT